MDPLQGFLGFFVCVFFNLIHLQALIFMPVFYLILSPYRQVMLSVAVCPWICVYSCKIYSTIMCEFSFPQYEYVADLVLFLNINSVLLFRISSYCCVYIHFTASDGRIESQIIYHILLF